MTMIFQAFYVIAFNVVLQSDLIVSDEFLLQHCSNFLTFEIIN